MSMVFKEHILKQGGEKLWVDILLAALDIDLLLARELREELESGTATNSTQKDLHEKLAPFSELIERVRALDPESSLQLPTTERELQLLAHEIAFSYVKERY